MRIGDKILTAVCRTATGIEWTTIEVKSEGAQTLEHREIPLSFDAEAAESPLSSFHLPEGVAESLRGDITVALRTGELLMRVLVLPSRDDTEIAEMIPFQIEKISPFPPEQLAYSHERLADSPSGGSYVLIAAARRETIDAIGEAFEKEGVYIHSIDARILGWIRLLRDEGEIDPENAEFLLIDDGIDLSLVYLDRGIPLAFRAVEVQLDEIEAVDDLAYEIGYTLASLDAERETPRPARLRLWSFREIPEGLAARLAERCGVEVTIDDLGRLPPLSEGILRRALDGTHRIEFIPAEWVELQQFRRRKRLFLITLAGMAAAWLIVFLLLYGVYRFRVARLHAVQAELAAIEPEARAALQEHRKIKALRVYADRTRSPLECLREVTRLLPDGDIKFVSFNYKKDKGITLRGSAASDNLVYDFFEALSRSPLFDGLKDQSVNTRISRGIRRSVFSVTLLLPQKEVTP